MRRILVAESHGPTREFVTETLAGAGFQVLGSADPREAYELFAAQRPQAVVVGADFGDDVVAFTRRLRAADPRALVIVTDKEHLGRARGLQAVLPVGANGYVADPTKKELLEKVRHLVIQSAATQAALRGTALVLSRPPSSAGEVRPGVVARLLHQLWRALSDGVLVLAEGGLERRLLFLRGVPVAFQSADPADALLGWMAASGRLDEPARRTAMEGMASGLSPGAALIAAGVLEPGAPLQAALRGHLEAMVVRSVAQREGRWRFHPGQEFAAEVHPVAILPLHAVLEGARAGLAVKHFAEALRPVMEGYPTRTAEFQQLLPAMGLSTADLRVALSLEGRATTRQFLDERQRDLKEGLSLLWFLALVNAVAFREEPAGGGDPYGQAWPRRKKRTLPPDRAEALRQAALQILPGSYFRALGVDIAADAQEVERAYHEVSSRFHPDGFAEYDPGDLTDLLAAVQDKVSAAYRVLSNAEKRRAYLGFLVQKLDAARVRGAAIDVEAEIAFRRGERALETRRSAEAITAIAAAVELNPREPEYHAMLGFAELFDPVLPRSQRAVEARKSARRALQLAPGHPRATAVLALSEHLAGDAAEARRVVLAGLKAHPENVVLKEVLHHVNKV